MYQTFSFIILFSPIAVFAQGTLQSVIGVIGTIAGLLFSILLTFAFVALFYGIALFVFNSGDEKKVEEGKQWMLWSVIAIFVLVTIWGIIGLLQKTVGNTEGPDKVNIIVPKL